LSVCLSVHTCRPKIEIQRKRTREGERERVRENCRIEKRIQNIKKQKKEGGLEENDAREKREARQATTSPLPRGGKEGRESEPKKRPPFCEKKQEESTSTIYIKIIEREKKEYNGGKKEKVKMKNEREKKEGEE